MTPTTSVPLSETIQSSIKVLTKPSIQTFEEFENRGTLRDALVYVAVGAAVVGVFNLFVSPIYAIGQILATLAGFYAFTYAVHYVGKAQGGTGTLDQVGYTFSLYWIPLQIVAAVIGLILTITLIGIFLLPLLGLAALAASIYFAYLAIQSSMNMSDSTKIIITLLAGIIAAAIVSGIVGAIFARPQ
jgi:hypothetical protein